MLPDLTVLIALVVGLWSMQEGDVDPLVALLGTLASMAVGVSLTWMAGERSVRAVKERKPLTAVQAARQVELWPLAGWVAAVGFFGWGTLVANEVPREGWILRYLVLLVPAAVLFAAGWVQRGRIEAAMAVARGASPAAAGTWGWIRQALKRNGIALLPMAFILGLLEGIWLLGELGVAWLASLSRWLEAMPLLSLGLMLVVLSFLTLFLPWIFQRVFSTESLPGGPMRTLLERHATSLGLAYRDILLWKTGGKMMNAMVVGVTPGTRRIFLTDALLRNLPQKEVLAVFSHEAGHAKKQHLPLFLLLFVTTAVVFHFAGEGLERLGVSPFLVVALHLGFLWFVLLGSISRLFEREADLFGARHAAALFPEPAETFLPGARLALPTGTAWMISALERIQALSGRGASHRHGTIESRARFLAESTFAEDMREDFRRRKRSLLLGTLAAAVLAIGLVAWRLPDDLVRARGWVALDEGIHAYEAGLEERNAGREEAARAHWEEAWRRFGEARGRMQGRTDEESASLRLLAAFNQADSAWHGLDDPVRGRAGFEAVLAEAAASGLPDLSTRHERFHAHVDLGRIRAEAFDPGAFAHWVEARRAFPPATRETDAWYRARLQLLRGELLLQIERVLAVLPHADVLGLFAAARRRFLSGEADAGERILRRLSERQEEGPEWDELRRDARRNLPRA